jgi:hypothetical protein
VRRRDALKAHIPVTRRTTRKVTTSMIAAVNNRGLMRFMGFRGTVGAGVFIHFLRPRHGLARPPTALGLARGRQFHRRRGRSGLFVTSALPA